MKISEYGFNFTKIVKEVDLSEDEKELVNNLFPQDSFALIKTVESFESGFILLLVIFKLFSDQYPQSFL